MKQVQGLDNGMRWTMAVDGTLTLDSPRLMQSRLEAIRLEAARAMLRHSLSRAERDYWESAAIGAE